MVNKIIGLAACALLSMGCSQDVTHEQAAALTPPAAVNAQPQTAPDVQPVVAEAEPSVIKTIIQRIEEEAEQWVSDVPLDDGATGNRPDLWTGLGLGVAEMKSVEDLAKALASTNGEPAFIFKHSTTCSISGGANQRITDYIKSKENNAPRFYMVRVIESRPTSQAAAERLGVKHESPQIILVSEGKAVWSTSHEDITAEALDEALVKLARAAEKS